MPIDDHFGRESSRKKQRHIEKTDSVKKRRREQRTYGLRTEQGRHSTGIDAVKYWSGFDASPNPITTRTALGQAITNIRDGKRSIGQYCGTAGSYLDRLVLAQIWTDTDRTFSLKDINDLTTPEVRKQLHEYQRAAGVNGNYLPLREKPGR